MNQGQNKFLHFIMERVKDGKQNDAHQLLNEAFTRQADGSFDTAYVKGFIPRMTALIKPEHTGEVESVMREFGGPPPQDVKYSSGNERSHSSPTL